MKKILNIIILVLSANISFCQLEKNGVVIDKYYICTADSVAPHFQTHSIIDSLISLVPKMGVIKESSGGDYSYSLNYQVYYYNDSGLQYLSSAGTNSTTNKEGRAIAIISDSALYSLNKYYMYIGSQIGTENRSYTYLFISDGKIVESCISNVPINRFSNQKVKEQMKLFMLLFQE